VYNRLIDATEREPSSVAKKWYRYFVVTDADEGPAPSAPSAPPRSVPAPKRVVEAVPAAEAETVFAAPLVGATALEEIYRSAKIEAPAHGYTVLKVSEMLQSQHIRTLSTEVKRSSILVALDAAGVKVEEIVEDAVRRDRALDTYERVLQKHLEDLRVQKQGENRRLEEEINQRLAELRARIKANEDEVAREQNSLSAWQVAKRQEEERIAEAVSYFVSENPVTTSGPRGARKGDTDHVR
jgi:hypothetical protein